MLDLSDDFNRIVLINNNSTDDTDKFLENIKDDGIIYKNLEQNLGWSGGFSKELKVAYQETDIDYFWIMYFDVIPSNDAFDILFKTSQKLNDKFGLIRIKWYFCFTSY